MKDQTRCEVYKNFEIVQTLRENKHDGDYDLFTDVAGIYNDMESFAWISREQKEEKINRQMEYAKKAIDAHIKSKINPYEKFGFKYVN